MTAGGATCTTVESSQGKPVTIALIPVTSSQIVAIGYDAATRELVIQFRASGRNRNVIYSYDGAPSELVRGLLAAASPDLLSAAHPPRPLPVPASREWRPPRRRSSAEEGR
jgi:hypothetical protein